jgi:hypothetical protein
MADSMKLRRFVSAAGSGILSATYAVEWVSVNRKAAKVMKKPDPYRSEEDFNKHQEDAKPLEDFAKEEASRGFPYLHSIAIVRVWSILEVTVDDLVRRLFRTPNVLPAGGVIAKMEGPLLPFINASPEDRAELMFIALKQKLSVALKPGVARMEELLEPVGLHGQINDAVRRLLLELGAVRNVLVHRNGITDKRFIVACPWLQCREGRPLSLSHNHFEMYWFAVGWYMLEISRRVVRKFNLLTEVEEKELIETEQSFLSAIDRFLKDRPAGELTEETAQV